MTDRLTRLNIAGLIFLLIAILIVPSAPCQDDDSNIVIDQAANFIWVTSEPAGAVVEYDGREIGSSPVIIQQLPIGRHFLRFIHPAYEPLEAFCEVPNDGEQFVFRLEQQKGSCVVTSDPPGATLVIGPKVFGRTPVFIPAGLLAPGMYLGSLLKVGYLREQISIHISAEQPDLHHVALKNSMGTAKLTVTPAEANIYINNHDYGPGAAEPGTLTSKPREFPNIIAGRYDVRIEYGGEPGPEISLVIKPNSIIAAELLMWFPNLEITTQANRKFQVMVIKDLENGDLHAAIDPDTIQIIKAANIKHKRPIPPDEARELVQRDRRLRKMREQEQRARRPVPVD